MLEFLHIKNFAIVEDLEIDFAPRFNVITGETGAGKSIIIGALSLILGERADKSCIRTGCEKCEITGVFSYEKNSEIYQKIKALFDDQCIDFEDDNIIFRRIITANSSRCFINNCSVSLSILKEISELLVAIHGPNDTQTVTKNAAQKALLDQYGKLQNDINLCKDSFQKLKEIEKEITNIQQKIPTRQQVDLLKMQFSEISAAKLKLNEEEALKSRHNLAANSARILEIISNIISFISEDENSIIDQLTFPSRSMLELAKLDSQKGENLQENFFAIVDSLNLFVNDLEHYSNKIDLNQDEFQKIENRLRIISILKRKYGASVEEILAVAKEIQEKLDLFDNSEEKITKLNIAKNEAENLLKVQADKLSEKRKRIAKDLAKKVSQKLTILGFKNSAFNVNIEKKEMRIDGFDFVDFVFSPNIGEAQKPLNEIASSGEICRVMLALKTVLAGADHTSLLVFDEIDANIGGSVANMVGKELSALGETHQVLCISHLPQVAATGETHFSVEKIVDKNRTKTIVRQLENSERVWEITRMLGGTKNSLEVIEHAKSMLLKN